MSTSSVLKRVGLDIVKIVETGGSILAEIEGFAPILNPMMSAFLPPHIASQLPNLEGRATTLLNTVDSAIVSVEGLTQLGSLPPDQRLDTATSFVLTAFSDGMQLAGRKVQDPALLEKARAEFAASVKGLVQARVDFLNSLTVS